MHAYSRRLAVAIHRWILVLLPAAALVILSGCGGGNTANVHNPPPPPPSNISIVFQLEPAPALNISFSENLSASVNNDPNNYGVDWSLTCGASSNCGTLTVNGNTVTHTASGAPITYTAPSVLSTNNMVVEIVAYATADYTKNVVAPITISTFDSSFAAGNYVLQAHGIDSSFNPYQFAAAIVLDGNGNITSGEQTANYAASGSLADQNLTGNYFIGNDGRGTITINTNDTSIGGNGVESFTFVYLSSSQALISQMDLPSVGAATGVTASGTMNLQASTVAPAGGYAFVISGTDVAKTSPVAFGGVLNIDSPNAISGNGSVVDEILAKKLNATALSLSGMLTAPDSLGSFNLTLNAPFGSSNKATPLTFAAYIVDATYINLIETDTAAGSASPFGLTAGFAIGQGTATGTFTTNASFSGTYVFGIPGTDLSEFNALFGLLSTPATLTSAGLFTADGGGNLINGFADTFLALNTVQGTPLVPQTGAQISASFTGTYSVDSTGTGRASSTAITFNPEPKDNYLPTFFFYLTGNGGPTLVLESGDTHYPSIGAGIAYPQTGTAAFSGDYGITFTQELSGSSENDGEGPFNANATSAPPSLSGITDVNIGLGANQDQPFAGTFATPSATGPFPGVLVGANTPLITSVAFVPQIAVNYYFIDPTQGFFIETDLVNGTTPEQPGQVSLGYYEVRTPVCPSCP
jgi:hypothetical protein